MRVIFMCVTKYYTKIIPTTYIKRNHSCVNLNTRNVRMISELKTKKNAKPKQ